MEGKIMIMSLAFVSLTACVPGVKFDKSVSKEVNKILPPIIVDSVDPSIYRFDISSLVGNIAIVDSHGMATPYIALYPDNQEPTVQIVPESEAKIYYSIITKDGEAKFTNTLGNIGLSDKQKATLEIEQISRSMLKKLPSIIKIREATGPLHPKQDQKLVYITGAVLTRSKISFLDEIGEDATVSYGPVMGFNGKVYKQSNQEKTQYYITINSIDTSVIEDPTSSPEKTIVEGKKTLIVPDKDVVKELTAPGENAPVPNVPTKENIEQPKPPQNL